MQTPSSDEVTQLLQAWSAGDQTALEKLIPLVDDELQKIAQLYLRREPPGRDLEATELINEAFLRLIREPHREWQSRAHFFAIAAKRMRQILIDYARRNPGSKRTGKRVPLVEAASLPTVPSALTELDNRFELLALDEALYRLAKFDERKSKILELRYFGGLTIAETAEILGVSEATVMREWHLARGWLKRQLAPEQGGGVTVSGLKRQSIVLVPNQVVEPFLLSIPSVLNSAQRVFQFSVQVCESRPEELRLSKTIDVEKALLGAKSLKNKFSLSDNDLLISFISETLESRSRGLNNLFVAASSLSEEPPRVAIISTSFIHRYILPVDPTYLMQRHAFYHLIVCCIAGAFLELEAHRDRGCLMDFNSNTRNINRKIRAGYTFCDSCTRIVEQHPLGDALFKICNALKVWPSVTDWRDNSRLQNRSRVFLCYSGADRERVLPLYNRLWKDGFRPWMDKRDLIGGQDWQLEIRRAIESSDFFIACISASFQQRTYGHKEIKLALEVLDTMPEGAIYLIPSRLEPCEISGRLADRQWVDLFESDGYENLLKALRWNEQ
jgi:RNA polymerase sigma factor (TIGR02999 family)